jgi:multiple antibiotic resistance protein
MQELGKLIVTVLTISNSLGNLVIFINMAARSAPQQLLDCLHTMTIALFCIFAVSAIFGNAILSLFGVSISALECAGGMLLLKIGLNMIGGDLDNPTKPVTLMK